MDSLLNHPKYQKIRDLNSGTFGFVELALDKSSGQQVAIKFIERGEKVTKYVEREILNHRFLMHPHIVQFKEVFLTPRYLAIAMEFVAGGDMFEYVVRKGGLKESEARWFFQQLIVGVDYLHRMGVASRDIKLENTLLDGSPRPLLKICDFGYSKHEKFQSAPGSRVGTPAYLAPEVIMTTKGQTYDGKRILKVEYEFPAHVKVSRECRDLLSKILVPDPTKRVTIPVIQRHPWYLKDLPPGVAEMNDSLPQPSAGVQSVEDIQRIVREAQTPPAGPAGWDNDEYIDDAMDQERYDSSSYDEWGAPSM